jgi:hypothetical protein
MMSGRNVSQENHPKDLDSDMRNTGKPVDTDSETLLGQEGNAESCGVQVSLSNVCLPK